MMNPCTGYSTRGMLIMLPIALEARLGRDLLFLYSCLLIASSYRQLLPNGNMLMAVVGSVQKSGRRVTWPAPRESRHTHEGH